MKKRIVFLIFLIVIFINVFSYAYVSTIELDFMTINNKQNEDFDVYILLPKDYIMFSILNNILDVKYDGANTLKNNDIPGIEVEKENVQDELYKEDGTEYIQVLLEPDEKGIFKFDLLEDYNKLNVKYRIKNEQKDYIAHIDNFKIKNRVCEIEYNYDEDIIKQPDKTIINVIDFLFIILGILIVISIIAYIKKRR